jgi:tetratricopeptide (TPR) repeat protein
MPAGSWSVKNEVNETARMQASEAVARAAAERVLPPPKRPRLASVRVSPGGYFAVLCTSTFAASLLIRSELDLAALILLAFSWIVIPALAFTDRLVFDGQSLSRKGLSPFLLRLVGSRAARLMIDEIERVETIAVRTLRRGGRVRYRYRSEITGKGISFTFASGGKSYRNMVRMLFPLVTDYKLDARSCELRDYLIDPKSLNAKVKLLQLASTDVLEGATSDFQSGGKKSVRHQRASAGEHPEVDVERAILLRRTANELRAAGRLRQAAEAYRRALLMTPHESWLIYEFARFLRSQASAMGDARLLLRARAALRLAARRGNNDAALLSRIGEGFFEYGDLPQAARAFRLALLADPHVFRAELGLAEVALRNGKLAHVIHHYAGAARIATDEAQARYARREADYYALLNDDDEYLAAELRRFGWLQQVQRARRLSIRLTLISLLLLLLGVSIDDSLATVGWSLASTSIVAWILVAIAEKFLSQRRKAS